MPGRNTLLGNELCHDRTGLRFSVRSFGYALFITEQWGEIMSIPKKMTVSCSKCGKPLSVTVFESVNSDYSETLPMQIMSGDLFNAECPHCKFVSHLEYDILYHDMRHGAMVWVLHQNTPEYSSKLAELRSTNMLPYKTLRVVEDMNALKEKVSCLESGRDDRVVELCKVFTVYNLLAQKPDFAFRNAFYTAISGKEIIYIYDENGEFLCSDLSDKAYDYIKDLYIKSDYAAKFNNNYAVVDYAWAEDILIPLMESEAKRLSAPSAEEPEVRKKDRILSAKLICPKCKSSLPSDSEFCQKCGTKLSPQPVSEEIEPSNIGEQLLFESEIMEIKGDAPVVIKSAHLFCSDDREKLFLRCKFQSLSDKAISALMVDVDCFDVWGNQLPTICDAQVLDLNAKRNDEFGYQRKISIADINTRSVKVKLKRIRYTDGKIVACDGEEVHIPEATPLSDHFDTAEMVQQYIHEVSRRATFVPQKFGAFWMCSCGSTNYQTEEVCYSCGTNSSVAFAALDEAFLADKYAEYVAAKQKRDEQARQEKEKRDRAERERQEQRERERLAQIQREKNIAIQKRVAAIEAANKRKKIITAVIVIIVVAIIAVLIVQSTRESAFNGQLRNFAAETMNDDYTNVYADVVSMEPEYFVTTKSGSSYLGITDIICKCKTVEGKTIWVTIDTWDYPGGSSYDEDKNEAQYYSKTNPMRLTGTVTTAEKVVDRLENSIGNVFVLDVRELNEK